MRTTKIHRIQIAGTMLTLASLVICLMPHAAVLTTAESRNNPTSAEVRALPSDKSANKMRISDAYGKLPLSFEQNQGQAERKVKFLSRGPEHALLLTPTEAVLSLHSEKADSKSEKTRSEKRNTQSTSLRMKLIGANTSPKIEGRERFQGKSNYLIGNDNRKWRTDIPTYARVQYDEVYPGIDLVYYGNQRTLEYDFVVAPGADASAIRLHFDGANEMNLEADGSLRLKLEGGEVTQPAPMLYQKNENGEKQTIAGHYVLKGNEVAFELADYDRGRELVIDPQLVYATFYGGSDFDAGLDIAVDASGNAYITGTTGSPNLIMKSAYDGNFNGGGSDAYVVKLNPTGTDIVYATYFGSSDSGDGVEGIAVTSDGKACLIGTINPPQIGSDFPITASAYQGSPATIDADIEAFISVLGPGGNALVYSTFFGGTFAHDRGHGIAVDATNKIYITGSAASNNFPTKNAFQNSRGGGFANTAEDAFIAKLDPTLSGNSSLIYSSFLGGSRSESGNDIAVTPGGVAFIVGFTSSSDFPTKSSSSLPPFQTTPGAVNVKDSFIAKVSPTGALIYSTYFGGDDQDEALSVAVDSSERAYVTGFTESSAATFPLKNAFDSTRGGTRDAFVAKFNADGTALFYSSFLGGTAPDEGRSIAVDAGGNAYVTGFSTNDGTFPVINGFPSSVPAGSGFITKIEASDVAGTTTPKILYSDALSNPGSGIAVDPRGGIYLTTTVTGSFIATPGAFQRTFNGGSEDAAVIKIGSTFPDTIGTFRPPAGPRSDEFRLRNSNTTGPPDLGVDFGQAGDQALAGDWDGNGVDDVGVFRPSTGQFLLRQPTLFFGVIINATITLNFGLTGDKAVVGDWNGDGIDTPGVFRNGQWLLTNGPNTTNTAPPIDLIFNFGQTGDLPVAGDWNGDGIDSIGVYRSGQVLMRNSNTTGNADLDFLFGNPGFLPIAGDWNGDGIDTIGATDNQGLFVPGSTFFFLTNSNVTGVSEIAFSFGAVGDIPVAGDWNGRPDPFTPPNSGINNPSTGGTGAGQLQPFTTICSDPDGWRDIATIDFRIAKSDGNGNGVPIALWVQFNENTGLMSFYDPDSGSWQQGYPGTNVVLSSRFAELHLADATVLGSGPTGPSVQITWPVVFKNAAMMNSYKQYLMITDDAGLTTGFDKVGSWSVIRP